MPIITRPPVPPTSSSRRGDRANQARAVPAPSAQELSHSPAMATNVAPSSSICAGTWPACRSTNCGSTAAKNTIAFGLLTPTAIPSRTIRAMLFGSAA